LPGLLPALPGVSQIRLPPASPSCCDRVGGGGLSPPLDRCEVGPGRPAGVSVGGFPRPASRTRRAPL